MEFTELSPAFGSEVWGVEIAQGVGSEDLVKLTNALVKRKVLLFRKQYLNTEQYAQFGRSWTGTTRIDSFTEMHVPGYDDINIIGNVGELFANPEYRNGASFWHTDCAAEPDPDATTMLYCIEAPEQHGETIIADMQSAYDKLDSEVRIQIDSLVAHHCYAGAKPIIGGRESWEHPLTPVTEQTANLFPAPVTRPLVRAHSVSERKGLYAPAGSMFAIDGLESEAAHQLMRRIKLHAIDQQFCLSHRYRPGDLLMWDNTSTLHFGPITEAATGSHDRRLLHRISPLGLPAQFV